MIFRPHGALGKTRWVIPGIHIPLESSGHEPEFTSYDKIAVLNTSDRDAQLEIMIYQTDGDPIGPYKWCVPARRVKSVRFNDLIDPQALFLDMPYAAMITADVPIVVQFTHQDTTPESRAILGTIAFYS